MGIQLQLLLLSYLSAASLIGLASSKSGSAVFKLRRDACLQQSAAFARFLGKPTRLSCIVECVKSKKEFNAVQMLPGMAAGSLDCECVKVNSSSTPCCRTNCERWDMEASGGGSRGSGSTGNSDNGWNATICPEISDPWKPVVYVNKCFYRKNDANINITAVTNWSPCGTNGQLFDVKDSDAETQLVKYVNYLSDIGNPIAEFWAQDSRNGSVKCAFRVANNSLVPLSPCDTDGVNARNLFPICQRTLCFPGASPADFVIIQIGSSGLLWYHFNSSQVTKSNSCTGSQMASMESSDAFQHIKDGIVQRGWLGQPVWISSTGGYLPGGLSGCIALTINSTADSISMAASSVDCNSNLRQVCTYGFNNGGSSGGSSQSHGIVTDICPLSSQPPSDAQLVRTVGNLCYYHTGSSKSLSTTTDPNAACDSSGGKYKPALIDADYNKAKNYIFSIMGSVGTSWEAWMWTSNPGESLTSTNGDPITITVSGSGGYYMNRTGSPFKGNSSADRPVICRSDAEVCPSSLNYLNYASSSNSCVALQTTEASQAACATNCNGLGGGSLVQLESQEKYGQVRDVILINGKQNQVFWVNNGTEPGGDCFALRVATPMDSWNSSLLVRPCADLYNCICEKPFM